MLPPSRIDAARDAYQANQSILNSIGAVYGVEPRVILAIWGVESGFGTNQGRYHLIRSLATLAYQGRRAGYFTSELLAALEILARGYATPAMLTSGWAGAMGQPQFMPSVYLKSAVDFTGDGKRDIWHSTPTAWLRSPTIWRKRAGSAAKAGGCDWPPPRRPSPRRSDP